MYYQTKQPFIFLFIFLSILFSSCDPESQLIYSVKNNCSDTIYVQAFETPARLILGKHTDFVMIPPDSTEIIHHTVKIGWPDDKALLNVRLKENLLLVKGKDTTEFYFPDKGKCTIEIDGQIGSYTRIIN
jgi:hypothetical protein